MGSAGTVLPVPRQGATRPPGRVLLLSQSAGLAAVLSRLLIGDGQLTQVDSLLVATEPGELASQDAVVVDVPRRGRGTTLEHLRRHYRGPLVVLVEWGADAGDLPHDDARTLLARPFAADQLRAALGLPPLEQRRRAGSLPPAEAVAASPAAVPTAAALARKAAMLDAPPVGSGETVGLLEQTDVGPRGSDAGPADLQAAAPLEPPRRRGWPVGLRHTSPRRQRVELMLSELAHGWRTRRWVRVAGFSTVSLLAFLVAFLLAAQGGDDLVPTQVAPPPTYPLDLTDTPTTVSRQPSSTVGQGTTPGSGGFKGASASTSTSVRAPTTRPAAGGVTTRPRTTRQSTTTGGPTTTDTTGPTSTTLPQSTP